MRAAAGLVALNGGFLAVGESLLLGLGFIRSPRSAFRLAGLAIVSGWAATGLGLSLLLVLGMEAGLTATLVLWAGLVIAGIALSGAVPRRGQLQAGGERLALARWLTRVAIGFLPAYFLLLLTHAIFPTGRLHPDVWGFWLPKAKAIFYFGGLDTGPGGFTEYLSPDYPPLDPALENLAFRFVGSADVLLLPAQHWVIAAATFAAFAGLLHGHVRPAILWPSLAVFALMPRFTYLVGSSLGDEPLALLFALAGLCAALWLLHREPRVLVLCALFLSAASLTKNEGLMLSVILAVVISTAAGSKRLRTFVSLAAAPVLSYLIWRTWLELHDVPPNPAYGAGNLIDPAYLAARFDRFSYGIRSLVEELFSPSKWLFVVPSALALAALLLRVRRELALLAIATTALGVLGFAMVYWTSPVDLPFYVDSNVERVVSPIVFFLGALSPLLLAETLRTRGVKR